MPDPDPLAALLDPAAARSSGRLRPRVVGWPVGRLRRLPRLRRAGLVVSYCDPPRTIAIQRQPLGLKFR